MTNPGQDILSAMTTEEPSVEKLKAELKKLFRYSHNATALSDQVLACIKEFQGLVTIHPACMNKS